MKWRLLTLVVVIHLFQRVSWVTMVNAMDNDGKKGEGEKGTKPSDDKKTNLRSFPTLTSLNETEKLEQVDLENSSKPEQECADASSSEDPKVKPGKASDVSVMDEKKYKHEEQPIENVEEEEALYESEQRKGALEGPSAGSSAINETRDDEKEKNESSVLNSSNQENKGSQENTSGLDQDNKVSQHINLVSLTVNEKKTEESVESKNYKQEEKTLKDNNGSSMSVSNGNNTTTVRTSNQTSHVDGHNVSSTKTREVTVTKDRKGSHFHSNEAKADKELNKVDEEYDKKLKECLEELDKACENQDKPETQVEEEKDKKDEDQVDQADGMIRDENEEQQSPEDKEQDEQSQGQKKVEEEASETESPMEKFKRVARIANMVQSMRMPSFMAPEDVAENVEVEADEGIDDKDVCEVDEISGAQARHKEYEQVYMSFYTEKRRPSSSEDEVEQGVQSTASADEKVTLVCCAPKEGCYDSEIVIPRENPFNELVMADDGSGLVMGDDHNYSRVVTQQPVGLPPPSEELDQLDSILEDEENKENQEDSHWILHHQLGLECACETPEELMGCGMVRNGPIRTHRATVSDVGGVIQGKNHKEQHGKSYEQCTSGSQGSQEEATAFGKKKDHGEEKKKVQKTSRNNIVEGPEEMIDAVLGDNVRIIRSTAMLLNVWPVDYGNSRQVARIMNMELVDEDNLLGCYYKINVRGQEGDAIPMLIERSTGDEIMRIIRKKKTKEEIKIGCPEIKIPERVRKRVIVMEEGKVVYRAPGVEQVSPTERNILTGEPEAKSVVSTKSASHSETNKTPATNSQSTETEASCTEPISTASSQSVGASSAVSSKASHESLNVSYATPEETIDDQGAVEPKTPSCYREWKFSTESYSSTSTLSTSEESASPKSPIEGVSRLESETEGGEVASLEGEICSSQSESVTSGSSEEQVIFERGAVGGPSTSRDNGGGERPKTPNDCVYYQGAFGRGEHKVQPKRPVSRLGLDKEESIRISPRTTSRVRRRLEFLDEKEEEYEENPSEKGEYIEYGHLEMDESFNERTTSDSEMSSMVRSTSSGGAGIIIGDFSDEETEYLKSVDGETRNSGPSED
ncbi:hypothetical protein MACJ_002231 [Theileria orientalis]|uniref:Uncharacterized protein n=1 Tax=Theileria orientalis TaxID=68886 RepID=A0A976M5U3_THEOR|nr:hypothetical protein MACJ_002231 [Theileria orientalis]